MKFMQKVRLKGVRDLLLSTSQIWSWRHLKKKKNIFCHHTPLQGLRWGTHRGPLPLNSLPLKAGYAIGDVVPKGLLFFC